jgi:hypothetical protein
MSNIEDLRPTSHEPFIASSATPSPVGSIAPSTAESAQPPSTLHRTIHALRRVVPLVQRLLPLLDGNVAATVVNVLTSQSASPAPPVNLAPVEEGVTKLRAQNRELHDQLDEQNLALKRLEQHLEAVREAADRSALEQRQLLGALKKRGQKLNVFAFVALALLIISVLLNLALVLHLERALR